MKKKLKDIQVEDVKRYCKNKMFNIEKGYCAGCPFRISKIICLTNLFIIDGSMRPDITTKNELRTLRYFKESLKEIQLNEEIEVKDNAKIRYRENKARKYGSI